MTTDQFIAYFWNLGMNSADIAVRMWLHEAEVLRGLDRNRQRRRAGGAP